MIAPGRSLRGNAKRKTNTSLPAALAKRPRGLSWIRGTRNVRCKQSVIR